MPSRKLYIGPRGGQYYMTKSGRKRYVKSNLRQWGGNDDDDDDNNNNDWWDNEDEFDEDDYEDDPEYVEEKIKELIEAYAHGYVTEEDLIAILGEDYRTIYRDYLKRWGL